MSMAYWCVFCAALLPYIWVAVAKLGASRYNNNEPRQFSEQLTGMRQRAHWAQLNSFEAFPAFAVGVIIAQLAGVADETVNWLAVSFVTMRVIYGICYLLDLASLRSMVWLAGFAAMIALYLMAGLSAH